MKPAQRDPAIPDWHRVIYFGRADWEGEGNKIAVKNKIRLGQLECFVSVENGFKYIW